MKNKLVTLHIQSSEKVSSTDHYMISAIVDTWNSAFHLVNICQTWDVFVSNLP